jgi:transcriptional regulator with XRE-family HTH domain
MKKKTEKTPRGLGLGALKTDAGAIDGFMKKLGVTEAWLAEKTGLSQQYINRLRNGKQKNASPAATDRIIDALQCAWDAKEAADKPRLTPEAAARIRQRAAELLGEIPDEVHEYYAFLDLRNAVDPDGLLSAREALISLGGPPRDPVAYEAWKAKQIELHAAAKELPVAKTWIRHQDKRVAALTETEAVQKEIISNLKEIAALREGQVNRLRQQLLDAGITPTD